MAVDQIDIQVPGHRILRKLGGGGMANVYLALQESIDREVALKIMRLELGASDSSFSQRFVREAKIIAKLSHPHINAVYDVGVAGPYHYFTMEYITGGDLKMRIRQGMSPQSVLSILRQICSALAFAHSKGYVHRDVKPENVLFRDSNTAVLTDFGIAKSNDTAVTSMTVTGTIMGTPHYMSPEQALGGEIDRRSDLYSLGAMLFEMFTGNVPYTADSTIAICFKHLSDPLPQLPPPLEAYQPLLDKFLAKNPADRFQSGEEAMAAIDALGSGASMPAMAAVAATSRSTAFEKTVVLDQSAATAKTVAVRTGDKKSYRSAVIAAVLLVPLIAGGAYLALRRPAVPPPIAAAPAPAPVVAPVVEVAPQSLPAEPVPPAPAAAEAPKQTIVRTEAPRETAPARPARVTVEAPKQTVIARAEDPRERELREREQKVQGLLTRFQELVAPGSFSAARAGRAQDLVDEATRLAPDDSRVRALPGRLADAYLDLATIKADEKNYQESDTLIRRGLELKPDHRQLLALQKDIAEKQKPKRQTFGSF